MEEKMEVRSTKTHKGNVVEFDGSYIGMSGHKGTFNHFSNILIASGNDRVPEGSLISNSITPWAIIPTDPAHAIVSAWIEDGKAASAAARKEKMSSEADRLRNEGKIILHQIESLDDGWGEGTDAYLLEDEDGNRGYGSLWRSVYDFGVIAVSPEEWKIKKDNLPCYDNRKAEIASIEARKSEAEAEREAKKAAGEKVEVRTYPTHRCMNGNDNQCGLDIATVYAMPSGKIKTVYTCTF
jgi:hypothetical protein